MVAQNYKKGQELIRNRDFKKNEQFYQLVFEIGRRYKIMNPDRMRSEYGKLLYLLMDASNPVIQDLLEFSCIRYVPIIAAISEAVNCLMQSLFTTVHDIAVLCTQTISFWYTGNSTM